MSYGSWVSVLVAFACSAGQDLALPKYRNGYAQTEAASRRAATQKLTHRDTVVLADFTNLTRSNSLDGTLDPALRTALEESPFLNVLSPSSVASAVKDLGDPSNTPLTVDIANSVCQHTHSKVYISGVVSRGRKALAINLQ